MRIKSCRPKIDRSNSMTPLLLQMQLKSCTPEVGRTNSIMLLLLRLLRLL